MSDLDKMMAKLGKTPAKEEEIKEDEADLEDLEDDEDDLDDEDDEDDEEEEKVEEKPKKSPKSVKKQENQDNESQRVAEELSLLHDTAVFRRELLFLIREHNEIQKVMAEGLILLNKKKKK